MWLSLSDGPLVTSWVKFVLLYCGLTCEGEIKLQTKILPNSTLKSQSFLLTVEYVLLAAMLLLRPS